MRLIGMVLLAGLLVPGMVHAEECGFEDGGYCVSVFLEGTAGAVEFKVEVPQGGAGASLSFYETFWDRLVRDRLAAEAERDFAFSEAARAGGKKIGGYNLVVLATRTLQHLIDKGFLTIQEAQAILNGAKLDKQNGR